jgi:tetratricopeptide (TPR) repeat protein
MVVAAVGACALAISAAPERADAQYQRRAGKDAKFLLVVPAFQSTDKELGYEAAVAVRSHVDDDADPKKLWVIPQQSIEDALTASGFPAHEPISPTDAKQLASALRGDAYLDGMAIRTATGVRLEARLVLARDNSLVQPLPPADAPKVAGAAKIVSAELQEALKQLPGEEACYAAARAGKYAEALAAAHAAIVAYPAATLARLCEVSAFAAMKQPPDSILRVTQEVLATDPKNRTALDLAAQAAYDKKDYDQATKLWGQELTDDPSNVNLVEDVVTKIVAAGHPETALPIIDAAIAQNPTDPKLLALKYRLLIVAKRWKDAAPLGEQVAKADTSFADTVFYEREVAAYVADSQPQQAAEAAARGISKFPGNATLQLLDAQSLSMSGQTQQAAAVLTKYLAANPKDLIAWQLLFRAEVGLNQPDTALATLHKSLAAGDSVAHTASLALVEGNRWYKMGNANKNRDTLLVAARYLAFADSLTPRPEAELLLGTTQFVIGIADAQQAPKDKSCPLAREAQANFKQASENLRKAASLAPAAVAQYTQYLKQYSPVVDRQVAQFCK